MLLSLQKFKQLNRDLYNLSLDEQERTGSINLIKYNVLELGDRFDQMQVAQM